MNISWIFGEQKLTSGLSNKKRGKGILKAYDIWGNFKHFSLTDANEMEIPYLLQYGLVGFSGLAETQSRDKNPNPCGL